MGRKTVSSPRVLSVVIATAALAAIAIAAPGVQTDKAATGALRFGGTLSARPVGAAPASRAASPQKTLATAPLLDSYTGAVTYTITGSTPRSFMGSVFTLADPLLTPIQITSGTLYMVSAAAVNYSTNVRANIQFYDTYTTGAVDPVFSSATGGVQSFDIGPLSTAASTIYAINVTFSTPITFAALTDRGLAVNFQGDSGSGLASTDNLTALLRYGATGYAAGSSSVSASMYGFRNVTGRTDFNFASTDARSFAQPNQGLAIKLNGNATFPVTLQRLNAE